MVTMEEARENRVKQELIKRKADEKVRVLNKIQANCSMLGNMITEYKQGLSRFSIGDKEAVASSLMIMRLTADQMEKLFEECTELSAKLR